MIASEDSDSVLVPYLQSDDQRETFDTIVASIDIISQEKKVSVLVQRKVTGGSPQILKSSIKS